jgi:ATP-dependent Clp protease ATP-binding subunit ClpC
VEGFDPEDTTRTAADKARFTFRGEPKTASVPDTVPAELGEQ